MNWKAVDLNLLVVFRTLMETKSVSLAADRLFVGQSAMSHSLSRLRELLNDPLFERQGHKMIPTAKAIQLYPMIDKVLQTITGDILKTDTFEASEFSGTFKIGMTDYAELLFAADIFDAIHQLAPKAQLCFTTVDKANYQDKFDSEPLDLVIGSMKPEQKDLQYQKLYTEKHVCMWDGNRHQFKTPITLDDYLSLPHALVSPDGSLKTGVDKQLSALGAERAVSVASKHFLTIRHLMKKRNLICVVPELMAQLDLFSEQLVHSEPPIEVGEFDIQLIWQTRNKENKRYQWLKELLIQTIEKSVSAYKK
ncbi:LysR family transcriptional regulator [Aliivibrio salmonicida]|uniref:LysR family transcriptional regulator n=2 Tax=Aliivibrio salmonicida TaxID=40269 RepID=UPI0005CA1601|nr:LysR family transcriptional regulator [Aliivibrio salmonicida]